MPESPTPVPAFEGRIGRTLAESEPFFAEPPHPGEDAPNVVIVLLDDTGLAQFGCYGLDIDTANVDRLAAGGLRFTNFHVTPLCSPTRASLLTGRSQHAVGMRTLANFSTGFPHQLGHISNHAATVAEVLGAAGYATFCAGKWHLAHTQDSSAAGPFDQPPLPVPAADVAHRGAGRAGSGRAPVRPRRPSDPRPGDEGVIWATGTVNAGVSVFVQNERLVVDYNAFGDHAILESSTEVPSETARCRCVSAA